MLLPVSPDRRIHSPAPYRQAYLYKLSVRRVAEDGHRSYRTNQTINAVHEDVVTWGWPASRRAEQFANYISGYMEPPVLNACPDTG
jgi:hypothetical protein